MKDLLHGFTNWIDHNRYAFAVVVLSAVVFVFAFGCTPTVVSPITGKEVTSEQLAAEVRIEEVRLDVQLTVVEKEIELLAVKTGPAFAELERRKQAITKALEAVDQLLGQYAGPYGKPIATALGIIGLFLGGGLKADNVRKDGLIK